MGVSALSGGKRKELINQLSSIPVPNSKNPKLDFQKSAKVSDFEEKRRVNTQKLLGQKKLVLLLDLDHTLLNAVNYMELSLNEDYLLYTPSYKKSISIWEEFIIKLRPYVHTFLSEASKLFDLYICTMASHLYALKMAELLDPQGIYFNKNSKIISREEFKEADQKDLSLVLGEERIAVILDDSMNVWKGYKDSLIVMSRYNYFSASHKLFESGGYSLCEMKEDEDEVDGGLALTLYVLRRIHRMFFDGKCKDVRRIMKMIGDEVENGACGMDVNGTLMDEQRWVVGII